MYSMSIERSKIAQFSVYLFYLFVLADQLFLTTLFLLFLGIYCQGDKQFVLRDVNGMIFTKNIRCIV